MAGEGDVVLPGLLEQVAFAALMLLDKEKALRFYERALALRGKLYGDDALDVGLALERTASAYESAAMYDRAIPLSMRGVNILEAKTDSRNMMRVGGIEQLVRLYLAQGRDAEAAATYEKLVRAKGELYGPDDPAVAGTLEAYARTLRKLEGGAGRGGRGPRGGDPVQDTRHRQTEVTALFQRTLADCARRKAGRLTRLGGFGDTLFRYLALACIPPESR